jgi:hypothetical protein
LSGVPYAYWLSLRSVVLIRRFVEGLAMRKDLAAASLLAGVLVTCALFFPGPALASNLLLNPSFEIGSGSLPISCGTGCSYSYDSNSGASGDATTIPDWVINPFASGGVYVPGGTPLEPVPDGIAVAFTNGGTIQQTVGTVVVGDTYSLTGWVANYGGPGYNSSAPQQAIELLICNSTCGFGSPLPAYATPTGATLDNGVWTQLALTYTVPATGPGGGSVIGDSLTVLLFAQGNTGEAQFDDFSLTATPLPPSWTMLLAGLVGFGLVAYRRTKSGSAAFATA